jgi:hypothetical protein
VENIHQRIQQQRAHVHPEVRQELDTGSKVRRRAVALLRQAAEAKALDGRLIQKNLDAHGGHAAVYGSDSAPHFFIVEFQDGVTESMQLPVAERYLLPASAVMPQDASALPALASLSQLPHTWLDIALPLIVAAAQVVACVHVPGHYLSSGVQPRYAYLRQLQQEGRLVILFGLLRAATGWRCAWLLAFRSAALKQRLLRPGLRTAGLCFD